ncbi:MAG TPA: type II secretion system F family protein [Pirellulaceae bacterium]|nr:type II secretion system F family protein [Pirellulaceae bacterium]
MISTTQLARLCRRAATSLHAGLDARQVCEREATVGPASQRGRMTDIVQRIDDGETVGDALAAQHGYFPQLVVEMVHVGEQTGRLEQVFAQLADHYENLISLRRVFLMGLAWPAIQLVMTLGVIGLLIWIMGVLPITTLNGDPVDLLGLGLKGTTGLIIYVNILLVLGLTTAGLIFAWNHGYLGIGGITPLLMRIPVVGNCLKYLAMSRLAWCLSMAIDAGMDAVGSIRLALNASQNSYYSSLIPRVEKTMLRRCPMHDALRETERFPEEFLVTLETGELSGMVSETLARYGEECRDRAQALLKTLTVMLGTACGLSVSGLIVYLIFRLASFYLGTINDAINLTM